MNLSELTRYFANNFKNAPGNRQTRQAYDQLRRYGEYMGVDLTRAFFRNLLKDCQENQEDYTAAASKNELDRLIIRQMQQYITEQAYKTYAERISDKGKTCITGIEKQFGISRYTGYYKGIPFQVGMCRPKEVTLLYPPANDILCELFYREEDLLLRNPEEMCFSEELQERMAVLDTSGNFDASDPEFDEQYVKKPDTPIRQREEMVEFA